METTPMRSTRHSILGPRLRRALAWVILPGLALGVSLGCGPGTSTAAPSISSINPTFGNAASSTTVLVTGSGFSTGLSNVLVGGVASTPTNGAAFSDSTLTLNVPAGAITGPVTVVTTGGSASSPEEFVVVPVLTAAATPASGSASGQTLVTLTGQGLLGVSYVSVTLAAGGSINVAPEAATTTANTLNFNLPTGAQVSSTNQMELLNNYGGIATPVLFQYDVTPRSSCWWTTATMVPWPWPRPWTQSASTSDASPMTSWCRWSTS